MFYMEEWVWVLDFDVGMLMLIIVKSDYDVVVEDSYGDV